MQIYPAILTESIAEAQDQVIAVASIPNIRTVQIDIIDGIFADNSTITPSDLVDIDFGELSCDLHLMTEEPLDYVNEAIATTATTAQDYDNQLLQMAQGNIPIRSIIGQIERMSHQTDFVQTVKENAWKAGISLDLFTPLEEIEDQVWHYIDSIQLMGIEAGFQGQIFHESTFTKITELQQLIANKNKNIEIYVDGGLTPEIASRLKQYSIHAVVVGSSIWQSDNVYDMVDTYLDV